MLFKKYPKVRTLHSPIDSRWSPPRVRWSPPRVRWSPPRVRWSPPRVRWTCGLQVDSRWIIFGREPCQIRVKIHLESTWLPPGLQMDYVDCVDSTPPHAYDAEKVDSTWILVDSTWTLVLKWLFWSIDNFLFWENLLFRAYIKSYDIIYSNNIR
jgi:hypothetical protein